MIAARQVVHPRLRYGAVQFSPVSRLISRGSRAASASTVSSQPTPKRRPWLRRFVYFGIFAWLGAQVGILKFSTKAHLEPVLERATVSYAVRRLRHVAGYLETEAYGNFTEEDKEERLTSGLLGGSGKLAFQKILWHYHKMQAFDFVVFGRQVEGWPLVIHGGALATVLDEHLARVAIQNLPARTAVTANLNINYKKPAISGKHYVIEAVIDQERSTDQKAYVEGIVRDSHGEVYAEATGLFVVPRGYQLRKLEGSF
ncbi:hypothetical protein BDW74DRAFT_178780 [Aspergillus multicolor]|uniref:PaaI family thioesterase n=1 Tax=Aspergillus multicolor TaxID=41759 RepID=UPI003CCE35AE